MSTAENFLRLIRSDGAFTQAEAEILDLALILHAEHGGGNNSSFATHVVTSSGTDTYSAISAAVGSLKGPLHGGANVKVIEMMDFIKAEVKNWSDEAEVADLLTRIVKKEAFDRAGLIYGMGHPVYTISDPRTAILKSKARELSSVKNLADELDLYALVERLSPVVISKAKKDEKPFAVNVDFYSGFVYRMLGIPQDLFTPIFAIARVPGWCAHRIEEIVSGGRIIRPAYKNVMKKRLYVPLAARREHVAPAGDLRP
jgi:citrate synthase